MGNGSAGGVGRVRGLIEFQLSLRLLEVPDFALQLLNSCFKTVDPLVFEQNLLLKIMGG